MEEGLIPQAIREVERLRRTVAALDESRKEALAGFDETYSGLFAELRKEREALDRAEEGLRALVVEAAETTGEQKPAPGVEAVKKVTVEYDPGAAFDWAKQTGIALALDQKAFEKIALATSLPFVTRREGFAAKIARDLSKAVEELGS
jgi:hypothetical protein